MQPANSERRSLQHLLDSTANLVDYLCNDTPGPHSRTRSALSPVPLEFSNWRDEQRAWRETAVLFDQSHHMPELFLRGPDAFKLLHTVGINSLANFRPGVAKQFVGCNDRGRVIGECILHSLGDDVFELVSGMPLLNWVHYVAVSGSYNVNVERDNASSENDKGTRVNFRFGLDGPNASKIFDEIVDGGAPEISFFRTARVRIAGVDVLALRHGMAGHKGVELSGPWKDRERVRAAILTAGKAHGLRQGGTRAYFSTPYESGWIAYPLPAIYTGEWLRPYREWLSADSWEAKFQLGGSFRSNDVEDYYVTPYDLGYERIVNFDHDFIGKDALQAISPDRRRKKMTLVWNKDDVTTIWRSLLEPGIPCKYLELPVADYAIPQCDAVYDDSGKLVGLSTLCGYSTNERDILSLAMIDVDHAQPGTAVTVLWGEPDGGSRKPRVERHRQISVRAIVQPAPYARAAREMKTSPIGAHATRDGTVRF